MTTPLGRLVIYTKKIPEMVDFYCDHFGFKAIQRRGDIIVELRPSGGGSALLLHPAAKGQKEGQTLVKLVFDVEDVPAFCERAKKQGLCFGAIHSVEGYEFSNAKDPSNNSVSVSSRAFSGKESSSDYS